MLDTIDKLTKPTAWSLLDGTMINVELTLAKVFPFQKACHSVSVQDGYVVVQPVGEFRKTRHPRNVEFNKVLEACFSGAGNSRFSEAWNL
jgi:hypothetical protein